MIHVGDSRLGGPLAEKLGEPGTENCYESTSIGKENL